MNYLVIRAENSSPADDFPEAICVVDCSSKLVAKIKSAIAILNDPANLEMAAIHFHHEVKKWCDVSLDSVAKDRQKESCAFLSENSLAWYEDEGADNHSLHVYKDGSFGFIANCQDGTSYESELITLIEIQLIQEEPAP